MRALMTLLDSNALPRLEARFRGADESRHDVSRSRSSSSTRDAPTLASGVTRSTLVDWLDDEISRCISNRDTSPARGRQAGGGDTDDFRARLVAGEAGFVSREALQGLVAAIDAFGKNCVTFHQLMTYFLAHGSAAADTTRRRGVRTAAEKSSSKFVAVSDGIAVTRRSVRSRRDAHSRLVAQPFRHTAVVRVLRNVANGMASTSDHGASPRRDGGAGGPSTTGYMYCDFWTEGDSFVLTGSRFVDVLPASWCHRTVDGIIDFAVKAVESAITAEALLTCGTGESFETGSKLSKSMNAACRRLPMSMCDASTTVVCSSLAVTLPSALAAGGTWSETSSFGADPLYGSVALSREIFCAFNNAKIGAFDLASGRCTRSSRALNSVKCIVHVPWAAAWQRTVGSMAVDATPQGGMVVAGQDDGLVVGFALSAPGCMRLAWSVRLSRQAVHLVRRTSIGGPVACATGATIHLVCPLTGALRHRHIDLQHAMSRGGGGIHVTSIAPGQRPFVTGMTFHEATGSLWLSSMHLQPSVALVAFSRSLESSTPEVEPVYARLSSTASIRHPAGGEPPSLPSPVVLLYQATADRALTSTQRGGHQLHTIAVCEDGRMFAFDPFEAEILSAEERRLEGRDQEGGDGLSTRTRRKAPPAAGASPDTQDEDHDDGGEEDDDDDGTSLIGAMAQLHGNPLPRHAAFGWQAQWPTMIRGIGSCICPMRNPHRVQGIVIAVGKGGLAFLVTLAPEFSAALGRRVQGLGNAQNLALKRREDQGDFDEVSRGSDGVIGIFSVPIEAVGSNPPSTEPIEVSPSAAASSGEKKSNPEPAGAPRNVVHGASPDPRTPCRPESAAAAGIPSAGRRPPRGSSTMVAIVTRDRLTIVDVVVPAVNSLGSPSSLQPSAYRGFAALEQASIPSRGTSNAAFEVTAATAGDGSTLWLGCAGGRVFSCSLHRNTLGQCVLDADRWAAIDKAPRQGGEGGAVQPKWANNNAEPVSLHTFVGATSSPTFSANGLVPIIRQLLWDSRASILIGRVEWALAEPGGRHRGGHRHPVQSSSASPTRSRPAVEMAVFAQERDPATYLPVPYATPSVCVVRRRVRACQHDPVSGLLSICVGPDTHDDDDGHQDAAKDGARDETDLVSHLGRSHASQFTLYLFKIGRCGGLAVLLRHVRLPNDWFAVMGQSSRASEEEDAATMRSAAVSWTMLHVLSSSPPAEALCRVNDHVMTRTSEPLADARGCEQEGGAIIVALLVNRKQRAGDRWKKGVDDDDVGPFDPTRGDRSLDGLPSRSPDGAGDRLACLRVSWTLDQVVVSPLLPSVSLRDSAFDLPCRARFAAVLNIVHSASSANGGRVRAAAPSSHGRLQLSLQPICLHCDDGSLQRVSVEGLTQESLNRALARQSNGEGGRRDDTDGVTTPTSHTTPSSSCQATPTKHSRRTDNDNAPSNAADRKVDVGLGAPVVHGAGLRGNQDGLSALLAFATRQKQPPLDTPPTDGNQLIGSTKATTAFKPRQTTVSKLVLGALLEELCPSTAAGGSFDATGRTNGQWGEAELVATGLNDEAKQRLMAAAIGQDDGTMGQPLLLIASEGVLVDAAAPTFIHAFDYDFAQQRVARGVWVPSYRGASSSSRAPSPSAGSPHSLPASGEESFFITEGVSVEPRRRVVDGGASALGVRQRAGLSASTKRPKILSASAQRGHGSVARPDSWHDVRRPEPPAAHPRGIRPSAHRSVPLRDEEDAAAYQSQITDLRGNRREAIHRADQSSSSGMPSLPSIGVERRREVTTLPAASRPIHSAPAVGLSSASRRSAFSSKNSAADIAGLPPLPTRLRR